jgi:hypothetical protein
MDPVRQQAPAGIEDGHRRLVARAFYSYDPHLIYRLCLLWGRPLECAPLLPNAGRSLSSEDIEV